MARFSMLELKAVKIGVFSLYGFPALDVPKFGNEQILATKEGNHGSVELLSEQVLSKNGFLR